jgi:hypothetical protein
VNQGVCAYCVDVCEPVASSPKRARCNDDHAPTLDKRRKTEPPVEAPPTVEAPPAVDVFKNIPLVQTAKDALVKRVLRDVDGGAAGWFVYPDAGKRIDPDELRRHVAWARRFGGTVLIEAACGDGKSHGCIRGFKEDADLRLLSIIPRTTLAAAMHSEYAAAGLVVFNYLDAQGVLDPKRKSAMRAGKSGIMSPESCHVMPGDGFKQPSTVFFDEVCMTGRSVGGKDAPFTSERNKPQHGLKVLQTYTRGCRELIAADADLMQSAQTLDWFSRMCPARPIRILQFTHRPLRRRVVLYKTADDVVQVMQETVAEFMGTADGERTCDVPVWVQCSQKEGTFGVKNISKLLLEMLPAAQRDRSRVATFHGGVGQQHKRNQLRDFTASLEGKLAVVANSALSVGVNCQTKFGAIFMFTSSSIPCLDDAFQGAKRGNRELGVAGTSVDIHCFVGAKTPADKPREKPAFLDIYKKHLAEKGDQWSSATTRARGVHDETPDWYTRLRAHVNSNIRDQQRDFAAYFHDKCRHAGWEVVSAPAMSGVVTTLSGLTLDCGQESDARLATDAEMYKHFIERGVDTDAFFSDDRRGAPQTCDGLFDRKIYFACRHLRGFPYVGDEMEVTRGKITGGTVNLEEHRADVEQFIKHSFATDRIARLRCYINDPAAVKRRVAQQAATMGVRHPEFTGVWQRIDSMIPSLKRIAALLGVRAVQLFDGVRAQGDVTRGDLTDEELWQRERAELYEPVTITGKLLNLMNLINAQKKLLHKKRWFVLSADERAAMDDGQFVADIQGVFACTIVDRADVVKRDAGKKTPTLWNRIKQTFKVFGIHVKQTLEARRVGMEQGGPKQNIRLVTSIVCELPDMWAGWHVSHPKSGWSVPLWQFDDHDAMLTAGQIDQEEGEWLERMPVRAGRVSVTNLRCVVDGERLHCLREDPDAIRRIVVAKTPAAKNSRVKRMHEWLAAVRVQCDESGPSRDCRSTTSFHLDEDYFRTTSLGRRYSGKGTIQTCPRELRAELVRAFYRDIDIENCHPVLVLQLVHGRGVDAPNLRRYVEEREATLREIRSYYECDRCAAKVLVLRLLNGGSPGEMGHGWLNDGDVGLSRATKLKVLEHGHSPYIQRLQPELLRLRDVIIDLKRSEAHTEMSRMCEENPGRWERTRDHQYVKDKKWSMFSWVLTSYEDEILSVLTEHFGPGNVGSLLFDGLLVKKGVDLDLTRAEAIVLDRTGLDIHLVEKPM